MRDYYISCEYDPGVTSSATDFDCYLAANGSAACEWADVKSKLPGCAYPYTYTILNTWTPSD